MLKFEYEQPLQISGVYITEEMLEHLSYIQTGTVWYKNKEHKHNNQGITDYLDDIAKITHHLIGNLMECDTSERENVVRLIETAHLLRVTFEKLKLPAELLTKQ
jgi:hypothetical protein